MKPLLEHIYELLDAYKASELAQIFRFVSFKSGEDYGPHRHRRIEINYVKKGACSMIFDDERMVFKENEMMIIFPFVEHTFIPHENGVTLMQLEFMPDLFYAIVEKEATGNFLFSKELLTNEKKVVKIINNVRITRAVHRIIDELMQKKEYYDLLVMMYYAELQLLISRYMVHTFFCAHEGPLAQALSIIHHSFNQTISIREIAKECGISERYLRKLFATKVGVSALEYLNNIRINKAKELLTNTDHSIKEIAFLVGFNSTDHFARVFRQFAGTSPRNFQSGLLGLKKTL